VLPLKFLGRAVAAFGGEMHLSYPNYPAPRGIFELPQELENTI